MEGKKNLNRNMRFVLKDIIVMTISGVIVFFLTQFFTDKKIDELMIKTNQSLTEETQSLNDTMQSLKDTIKIQGNALANNQKRIDTLEQILINSGVLINKAKVTARDIIGSQTTIQK